MSASRPLRRRVLALWRRFARAERAVAAIEFALVLPVMLVMYLGSMELGQAFTVDQRVTTIASTVGDLVARSNNKAIDNSTLTDYFQAAQAIIAPYPTTGLTQVISFVQVNATGTSTTVQWSKPYNGGVAKPVGSPYPGPATIPAAMLTIAKGQYIVVAEASYQYKPLLGLFFRQPFPLFHQNFYMPRYPGPIACTGC